MNKTMVQECLVGLSSFIALFFLCLSSLPLPLRSLRCVNGREHDVSRGDRGGDGSYPTPAGSPGAQRVRAALHVSVCVFSETRGSPFFEFFFFFNRDTVDTLNTTQRHACYFLHTYIKLGAQYLGKLSICPFIIPRAGHACSS